MRDPALIGREHASGLAGRYGELATGDIGGARGAAMRWLERYLAEGEPRLQHFAKVANSLAKLADGG